MLQEFKRLPEPLQKQTLIRLGIGALFLILLTALIITARDIYLWLPCAGSALFFAVAAFLLFRKAVLGEYVVVSGVCSDIGLTTVKRRAKYLILQTDECSVKVMLRSRMRKIPVGASVRLYVAKNTPVYEQNGSQIMYTYMAIDVK